MENPSFSDEEIKRVCRGAPAWITPEILRETLDTFNPYYDNKLTPEDVLEICVNVGQLFELLYSSETGRS